MTEPEAIHRSDHSVFGQPSDVSPWVIRFDPADIAFLEQVAPGRFRVRVWAEPVLGDATLVTRIDGVVESWAMDSYGPGDAARLWEVEIERPGFEYSFAFRSDVGMPVYFAPSGVTNAIERIDRWMVGPGDGVGPDVPQWARGAVIYQIFPDRFSNGDPATDPPDLRAWGSPPDNTSFYGGDLTGVTGNIDYLAALGVDAIYLNPIFSSASNHRYDTIDYYSVDWRLGGTDALRKLVEASHARGIRIILDASFNHAHPRFFAFADAVEHGADSQYADWFVVREWPLHVTYRPEAITEPKLAAWFDRWRTEIGVPLIAVPGEGVPFEPSYEAWYGVPTMPRVDLANPAARRYMLDVARHWVTEYDIDGWRMDVTRYVDLDFWDDLRTAVRSAKPDTYLLAEVFGDTSQWLQGSRFDATMNYTFRALLLHFFATRDISGDRFLAGLTRLWGMYGDGVSLVNHNALSTHDVPRFLTLAGGDVGSLELATSCQMLFPGAPGIYYGDEAGVVGGEDPECRATFPWEGDPASHQIHVLIAGLARLRRVNPVLRTGRFRPGGATDDAIAFHRFDASDRLTVGINRGEQPCEIDIPVSSVEWGDTAPGRRLVIPPRSVTVTHP